MKPHPWRAFEREDGWYIQSKVTFASGRTFLPIGPYQSLDAAKAALESLVNPSFIEWEVQS